MSDTPCMPTDVYLRFDNSDDRPTVLKALRKSLGPVREDELVENDPDGPKLVVNADDPHAAVASVQTLLQGALDETDIQPASVNLSLGEGFSQP